MVFYKLTLVCNTIRWPTTATYLSMIDKLRLRGIHLDEYHFEIMNDPPKKLHVHAIFQQRKNLYIQKYQIPKEHVYIQQICDEIDLKNWYTYIRKDLSKIAVEMDNYYKEHIGKDIQLCTEEYKERLRLQMSE